MHLVSFQPPWDLEIGKKFIIHYTYGCDYSLKVNYSPSLSLSTSICCFSHYDRALGYRVKSKGIFLLKKDNNSMGEHFERLPCSPYNDISQISACLPTHPTSRTYTAIPRN